MNLSVYLVEKVSKYLQTQTLNYVDHLDHIINRTCDVPMNDKSFSMRSALT